MADGLTWANADIARLIEEKNRIVRENFALTTERDRLAMELLGEQKANTLLLAGVESLCDRYDKLKHENRALREALQEAIDFIRPCDTDNPRVRQWCAAHQNKRCDGDEIRASAAELLGRLGKAEVPPPA